jgi:2-amino-4-hydroxy-6-hydroxymethyldihydropteridine diphosphokinase
MPTAFIGMGANLPSRAGPPEAALAAAAERLGTLGSVTRRSSLYRTEPVGFADQPRFVNAVVKLETGLTPRALLDGLLAIEHEFGRDRSSGIRNGPRTLDLDLLLYGNLLMNEPGMEIPHPRLAERAFVLIPLAEVAPSIIDARSGLTVSQLLDHLLERTQSGRGIETDAATPFQWHGWTAGACSAGSGASGGAGSGNARPDR